jgi:hypothetical protein
MMMGILIQTKNVMTFQMVPKSVPLSFFGACHSATAIVASRICSAAAEIIHASKQGPLMIFSFMYGHKQKRETVSYLKSIFSLPQQ